jgi:hypothetical protein
MAWETRGNHRYYYTARWEGGRCVKDYHGRDAIGERAAALVEGSRRRLAQDAAARRLERSGLVAAEQALKVLDEACTILMASVLTAAGFHRSNFSRRRRRRVRSKLHA